MIVSLVADRRTPDVAFVAHDFAVALREHLAEPVSLFVDRAASRAARGLPLDIEPRPIPASVQASLGGLRPAQHAVLAFVGSVTEPVITAFDLSTKILVVTDAGVASLRAAQRTFKLCRDVGYPAHRVLAVLLLEEPGDLVDAAAVRAALKREAFSAVPRRTGDQQARRAAFAELAARVVQGT